MRSHHSFVLGALFCTLIFTFALCFTTVAQSIDGLIPDGEFEGGYAYKTVVGNYPVLQLQGSWRQMGREYGGLVGDKLRTFYDAIFADMKARGFSEAQLDFISTMYETYSPAMKELLAGMAETSGLSLDEHIILDASFYTLPDFEFGLARVATQMAACSGIAVSAPRTADGKLYFARNWDMTPQAMQPYLGYLAVVVFNPSEGHSFANIRPLGQVYVETGFNEAGVFVELNNGTGSDPRLNLDARSAIVQLFDILVSSSSLEEMVENLCTTKIDASYIIQVADKAKAVSVEIPTFGSRVIGQSNGILYALNNFARPTPPEWIGLVVEIPEGYFDDRQINLDALFASAAWQTGVTVGMMKDMMDMQIDQGGPVVYDLPFGTVIQVIAIPEDFVIYFRGYGFSDWAQVDLFQLFN